MPPIRFNKFSGVMPVLDARQLPNENAQIASDVDVVSGALEPIKQPSDISALSTSAAKTIYKYRGAWLAWQTPVHVCRSPVFGEQYERIYYTGDGVPKVRGLQAGIDGAPTATEIVRSLGLPRPATAPTIAVSARTGSLGWYYSWTRYYEYGAEVYQVESGTTATVVTAGKQYTVAKHSKSSSTPSAATFQVYVDVYADAGLTQLIGRVYTNTSSYRGSSDLYLKGAKVAAKITDGSPATIDFAYSSSTITNYTIDRYYVMTYVSDWGEESAPSIPSSLASVDPTQQVTVTGIPSSVSGYTYITKIRLYRTVSGGGGSQYQYVTELALGTSSYVDTLYDSQLAEVLPSDGWTAPPAGLTGLVAMPGGFMAGFTERTVYFSKPYQPHAWPSSYALTVEHDIVGLAVSGSTLYVLTEQNPVVMTGSEPGALSQSVIASNYACAAPRSIIVMNDNVIYASPIGLIAIQGMDAVLLTRRLYSKEQWNEFDIANMFSIEHANRIYVFHPLGVLIFYPRTAYTEYVESSDITQTISLVTSGIVATAALADHSDDSLYMAIGARLKKWAGSTDPRTMTWRSKELFFDRPMAFAVAKVSADAYPVRLRLYGSGEVSHEASVDNDRSFRLPVSRREKAWWIEVDAESTVREIVVGHAMSDM